MSVNPRLLTAIAVFIGLAACVGGKRQCVPSRDPKVWGGHAWVILYHMSYCATDKMWSNQTFLEIIDLVAATMPCTTCVMHYRTNRRLLSMNTSLPDMVHALQLVIAGQTGRKKHATAMSREIAERLFSSSWQQYQCHMTMANPRNKANLKHAVIELCS